MSNNTTRDIYKAFTVRPYGVTDNDGVMLDLDKELALLKEEAESSAAIALWVLHNDKNLLQDLDNYLQNTKNVPSTNYKIADALNVSIPLDLIPEWNQKKNSYTKRASGASRFVDMTQQRIISEARSWLERVRAVQGTTTKYVSQGWERTVKDTIPSELKPRLSISCTDKQYAEITNNPFHDGYIELRIVISGKWRILALPFDKERFSGAYRITLPDITVNDKGDVIFTFTAAYEYTYSDFSHDYVVAVDVGRKNYATVSVVNKNKEIVYTTTLSQRVHSLHNSIEATRKQVIFLKRKGKTGEAVAHREANKTKRRELAIIAAQEIAGIAADWNNAIIVVEDLSWVKNTMSMGRWNRGELVKWVTHYAELNGSRVARVSAVNTSQECHRCQEKVSFLSWHSVYCSQCDIVMDRDINATGNIANRFLNDSFLKYLSRRKNSRKFTKRVVKRSPVTRNSLKYPGRDRSKNHATRKQDKSRNASYCRGEVSLDCSVNHFDDGTVLTDRDGSALSVTRTLEKQQVYSLTNLHDCRIIKE